MEKLQETELSIFLHQKGYGNLASDFEEQGISTILALNSLEVKDLVEYMGFKPMIANKLLKMTSEHLQKREITQAPSDAQKAEETIEDLKEKSFSAFIEELGGDDSTIELLEGVGVNNSIDLVTKCPDKTLKALRLDMAKIYAQRRLVENPFTRNDLLAQAQLNCTQISKIFSFASERHLFQYEGLTSVPGLIVDLFCKKMTLKMGMRKITECIAGTIGGVVGCAIGMALGAAGGALYGFGSGAYETASKYHEESSDRKWYGYISTFLLGGVGGAIVGAIAGAVYIGFQGATLGGQAVSLLVEKVTSKAWTDEDEYLVMNESNYAEAVCAFRLRDDFTPEELEKKRRELAFAHHPDRNNGDSKLFIHYMTLYEIIKAYRDIKDKSQKVEKSNSLGMPLTLGEAKSPSERN